MKTYIPSRLLSLVAGAIALGSAALSASAQLYNVDAGAPGSPTYNGAAVLGASGDIWNAYVAPWNWGPNNMVPISDATGSFAAGVQVDIWNYATGADNAGGSTPNPSALMQDYLTAPGWGAGDGWPIKVQLSNLPASTAFSLVVYSAGDSAGQGGQITLFDPSGNMVANTTAATRDITTGAGDAYVTFNGTTKLDGTVYFEVATTHDDWHALNGLQLQLASVPEPSALALGVCGMGLLMFFRNRYSR
jgi:hypothetical protein